MTTNRKKSRFTKKQLAQLEEIKTRIKAGKFDSLAKTLNEGEGFVVETGGVRIQLVKRDGKITANIDEGKPPKIFLE